MFLIGEEQIFTDPVAADPDPTSITEPEGDSSSPRPARFRRTPSSLHGARGLALAGLATGTLALLTALELGGGGGPVSRTRTSSPRSPLIFRSAAGVPAGPTARVHTRAARPAEVHRPTVIHHDRPRRPVRPDRSRSPITAPEPEREPTIQMAPVSSPAEVEPAPIEAPSEGAPPVVHHPPTSPPPTSSGGGPSGVESFGFER